jgi:hypothetical protein
MKRSGFADDIYIDYCQELGKFLDEARIRYKIDDKSQIMDPKKVRSAEKLYLPRLTIFDDLSKETEEEATFTL